MKEIASSRLNVLGKLSDKEDDLSTLDFSKENVDFICHDVLGNFTKRVLYKYAVQDNKPTQNRLNQ